MNEILEELSKDSSLFSVKFLSVEAEKLCKITQKYGIESVPSFVFIRVSSKEELPSEHSVENEEK